MGAQGPTKASVWNHGDCKLSDVGARNQLRSSIEAPVSSTEGGADPHLASPRKRITNLFSIAVPSSKMTLAGVKLTYK